METYVVEAAVFESVVRFHIMMSVLYKVVRYLMDSLLLKDFYYMPSEGAKVSGAIALPLIP